MKNFWANALRSIDGPLSWLAAVITVLIITQKKITTENLWLIPVCFVVVWVANHFIKRFREKYM